MLADFTQLLYPKSTCNGQVCWLMFSFNSTGEMEAECGRLWSELHCGKWVGSPPPPQLLKVAVALQTRLLKVTGRLHRHGTLLRSVTP